MATSREYADFIRGKFEKLDVVSLKPMMGEYVIHMAGKVLGFLADDQLLFQSGPTIDRLLPDVEKRELFPGSKLFCIIDDGLSSYQICELAQAIYDDLPVSKPRKKKSEPEFSEDIQKRFPFTKYLPILIVFLFIAVNAGAQVTLPDIGTEKKQDNVTSGKMGGGHSGLMAPPNEMKLPPIEYKQDFDERTKELEDKMAERSWSSESTAWDRACELDTKNAYQRYVSIYPNGAHRPEATQRLIDIQVNDIFNSDHGGLPNMKWVFEDPESETSTIMIENDTGFPLTVMYSGDESRSIVISPGFRESITLPNGRYNIAASVPAVRVRPFAGTETLLGGDYEVCFVIAPIF